MTQPIKITSEGQAARALGKLRHPALARVWGYSNVKRVEEG